MHEFKIVDQGGGKLKAVNRYPRGEFLASSDERFRPVNLFSAPDGTMYVVDMYRGVVQDGGIWSDYLRDYIHAHDLELPVGKGRIWRMVYAGTPTVKAPPLDPTPSLSKASHDELVKTLSNPNGWWRDTAQRLLVERNATDVAPALKTLAATATTSGDEAARAVDARRDRRDRFGDGAQSAERRQPERPRRGDPDLRALARPAGPGDRGARC